MMQIDIQTRQFSLTDALRDHVKRRVGFALSSWDEYVRGVVVQLSDINGPNGRTDKQCHIHIMLNHLPDVVVMDTEAEMYVAIDRSAARASRTVSRAVYRLRAQMRTAWLSAS